MVNPNTINRRELMKASAKGKIATASVTVLALCLGGAALAATSHGKKGTVFHSTAISHAHSSAFDGSGGPSDDLDAAASYLGVTSTVLQSDLQAGKTLANVAAATSGKTTAGLIAALVAAETTEWDAKVKAGTLTQAQETAMLPTLTQRFTDFVNGTGKRGGGPGGHGGHDGFGGRGGSSDDLDAAASYLGLTSTMLQSDLQAGKTLAQVAGATSGKTTAGLIAALVAAETTEWDAAVKAGTLTQAQETAMLPTLTQRFTDLVNGTGGHGGHGPGGHWTGTLARF
jgi:hypothetical protein